MATLDKNQHHMEVLIKVSTFIFQFALISVPIFLFVIMNNRNRVKLNLLAYLFYGLIITAVIMWTFAWWSDYSNQLLMSHYGYDFDAMNDRDRFGKVEQENLEKLKQLEAGYLGIGWPLKALMSFAFYSPYLLVVFIVGQLIRWIRGRG